MKTLILYYSFDWNTEFIAKRMAEVLWAKMEKIKTETEMIDRKSLMRYLWWWRMVFMKETPIIKEIENNIKDFDNIIIWTPVWAWSYSPPIQAIFNKYKFENKKIALFCCHGWWPGKTIQKMKDSLIWNNIVWEIDFKEPLKNDMTENFRKLEKWLEEVKISFDN